MQAAKKDSGSIPQGLSQSLRALQKFLTLIF